jgi:hypothetical protein
MKLTGTRIMGLTLGLALVIVGTGVVVAASSSVNASGQTAIRVVRENATTASATSNSTTYVDIPNATTTIGVASGTKALLVARFQGHGSAIQTSGCIVRILVGSTTMEPNGNYVFISNPNVSGNFADSGAIERSLAVGAGSYTVKAQLRLSTANSVSSQCQLTGWHFAVERHKRS